MVHLAASPELLVALHRTESTFEEIPVMLAQPLCPLLGLLATGFEATAISIVI